MPSVTLATIQAARERIRDSVVLTPCGVSGPFSETAGNTIYLKLENHQVTGAFKERGALNKILTLPQHDRACGLIAASAGNHAQAVAYHATRQGIRSEIWMPLATPLVKVSSTRGYGAEVVLHGENYDAAFHGALAKSKQSGLTFIHPFDDPDVIAGQGTLGLEILQQVPDLDAVVVPIGGGGLISGIACAVKESFPHTRIIGVQTARLPSMRVAVTEGHPVLIPSSTTIADGIAVRIAGENTLPLVRKYVDDIVTVGEEEIANAILLLLEREKTLAEGAGAVALAAMLNRKVGFTGKKVAVLISGGNIDVTLLSRIIERGLVKDGRLVRMRVHLPDHPGALNRLTGVLQQHRANIVQTVYDRAYHGVTLGETAIELTLETRGPEHVDELISSLGAAGYTYERIV